MWYVYIMVQLCLLFARLGNPYIYSILDWRKPGRSSLVTFFALMFLVVLHLLTYCVYLLRCQLYKKCCIKNQQAGQDKHSLTITLSSSENKEKGGAVNDAGFTGTTVDYLQDDQRGFTDRLCLQFVHFFLVHFHSRCRKSFNYQFYLLF